MQKNEYNKKELKKEIVEAEGCNCNRREKMKQYTKVRRGDVVEFWTIGESEQYSSYGIIISDDVGNKRYGLVQVIQITEQTLKQLFHRQLKEVDRVYYHRIRSIDKLRIIRKITTLYGEKLNPIQDFVKENLGIVENNLIHRESVRKGDIYYCYFPEGYERVGVETWGKKLALVVSAIQNFEKAEVIVCPITASENVPETLDYQNITENHLKKGTLRYNSTVLYRKMTYLNLNQVKHKVATLTEEAIQESNRIIKDILGIE